MNVKEAYREWSKQYDTNRNRTRDLEAKALKGLLHRKTFKYTLEVGCGTGKNSVFLAEISDKLLGIDLTEEMLAEASKKVKLPHVEFRLADITDEWDFDGPFDLVTFSLVLEHIEDIHQIFKKVASVILSGAMVYVGELHPFKQYSGTKARFESTEGTQIVTCFNHHISEFLDAASQAGFSLKILKEYWDEGDELGIPRILGLLFQKV